MLVLADWFSVDHLLARVDQGGPGQIIETVHQPPLPRRS